MAEAIGWLAEGVPLVVCGCVGVGVQAKQALVAQLSRNDSIIGGGSLGVAAALSLLSLALGQGQQQ